MQLEEAVKLPRAKALIVHMRPKVDDEGKQLPYRWLDAAGKVIGHSFEQLPGAVEIDRDSAEVLGEEISYNVITNAGRDFLHLQGYGSAGLGANGLNYIALSNDTLTETTASTTLSTEIAANGLTRAQGTYSHTNGTNTTTVSRVFTATGAQSAQKAALFTAAAAGTMNHALSFTQRSLQTNDTLTVTFTITLG